jgi:hypothetical protein
MLRPNNSSQRFHTASVIRDRVEPVASPTMSGDKVLASIEKARAKGLSVRAIAAKVGVGVGTVHRVIKGEHVSQI